jgi:hypothetical protein
MLDLIPIIYGSIGAAGVVGAMLVMRHPFQDLHQARVYVPRHRAIDRPSTLQLVAEHRRRAALPAVSQAAQLLAGLSDRTQETAVDRTADTYGGYGALATLGRVYRLDAARQSMRRVERRLTAPPRIRHVAYRDDDLSPWGTPEVEDTWDPLPAGVAGYAIAGRTR